MTTATYAIKSNGIRRQMYEFEVPGPHPPARGSGGVVKCDADKCAELVHFTSTDGLCLKCWTRAKTESVRRGAEARQDGQRKARETRRRLLEESDRR